MTNIDGTAPGLVITACFLIFLILSGLFYTAYLVVGYLKSCTVLNTTDIEANKGGSTRPSSINIGSKGTTLIIPGGIPVKLVVTPATPEKNAKWSTQTLDREEDESRRKAFEYDRNESPTAGDAELSYQNFKRL